MPHPPRNPRKTPVNVAFGAEIQYRRQQKGVKNIDLATCIGLSHQSITNIETGRQGISIEQFVRIADCLSIKPFDLLPARYQRHEWERE